MAAKHALVSPQHLEFVKRLAEQCALVFVATFVAALTVSGTDWTLAAASAAASTGIRAVYGYLVRSYGNSNTPSLL